MLRNIKFWIFLLFGIRLIGITNPPLEGGHSWRQSLTNMISRNFFEEGYNFLYPKIDYAAELTGIIGAEFPLYNLINCLFFELFGFDHWYGRLINLIVAGIGTYAFYLLVKRFFADKIAFISTIIFIVSSWFSFSRKIMPDTFSLSLMIIGLWQLVKYTDLKKYKHLFVFVLFASLSILTKLPSIVYFSLFILIPFTNTITIKDKTLIIISSFVAFGIGCSWYFYWVPHLVETYHYQLYFSKGILEGIQEIIPYTGQLLGRFYKNGLESFIAFPFVLLGIYFTFKNKQYSKLTLFGAFLLVFIFFIIKTGSVFPLHNYYILPFVPIMAICAGYGISHLPPKSTSILLILIGFEGVLNQQHDFFIKDEHTYRAQLETFIAPHIKANEQVIVNGGQNPRMIYFAHRKGWTIFNEDFNNSSVINQKIEWGAKFIVIDKNTLTTPLAFDKIEENENFAIYKIK